MSSANIGMHELFLRRITLAIVLLAIYVSLSNVYTLLVAEKNSYMGFKINDFLLVENLYLGLFAILPAVYLPLRLSRPSELVVWMLFTFVYMPGVAISVHREFSVWPALALFLSLSIFYIFTRVPVRMIRHLVLNLSEMFWLLKCLILLAVIFLLYLCWPHFGFAWDEHYERRLLAREVFSSGHLVSYFISIVRSAVVPFAVVLAVFYRHWVLLIITLIFLVIDWGSTGVKATFVIWFAAIFLTVIGRKNTSYSAIWVLLLLFVLITSPLLEYWLTGNDYIADYIIRRIFMVPGVIVGNFWDYLAYNHPTYYADTSLARLFGLTLVESPTYAVGRLYMGNSATNANTNFWMMEGARLGLFGPLFVSVVGGLMCSYVDKLTQKKAFPAGWCIAFIIGAHWSEQAFSTSLLTSGIMFSIILFALTPRVSTAIVESHRT